MKNLNKCYLFYLSEDHELRSKVSQTLELIKNGNDLYKSDLYKKIDTLTKLDSNIILNKMNKYDDFGLILVDFIKNVLKRKGNYINIFKSYIKSSNRLSLKYKKKMNRVLYFYENPDSILEENIIKDINYLDYIVDELSENREISDKKKLKI